MKIIINKGYKYFKLSAKGLNYFYNLKGQKLYGFKLVSFVQAGKTSPPLGLFNGKPYYGYLSWIAVENKEYNDYMPVSDITLADYIFTIPNPEIGENESLSFYILDIIQNRTDPLLIKTLEDLKEEAVDQNTVYDIIDIPDDIEWEVCCSETVEWIAEKHQKWGK